MGSRYEDLNDAHMDVLREIGNVGAGNAATSLSVMLDQPIDITLPQVNLVELSQVAQLVGDPEALNCGVVLNLTGELDGMILFLLDRRFAHLILNILMGRSYTGFDQLDDMALSALKEVGNILASSFAKSLCELTGMHIQLSVPDMAFDMAGALLSLPLSKFGAVGDRVLFIEEQFNSATQRVVSHVVLFAEIDSLNAMLKRLGLM